MASLRNSVTSCYAPPSLAGDGGGKDSPAGENYCYHVLSNVVALILGAVVYRTPAAPRRLATPSTWLRARGFQERAV